MNTLYHVTIHLGANEWSTPLMEEVAKQYFDAHPDVDPLVVEVVEHAGWYMAWLRDGTCVDTANDMAVLSPKAKEFYGRVRGWKRKCIESIRRPRASCRECGAQDREIIEGGLCRPCRFPSSPRPVGVLVRELPAVDAGPEVDDDEAAS
jgi:hypothetical protein